jgi:DNA-binding protein H-NS
MCREIHPEARRNRIAVTETRLRLEEQIVQDRLQDDQLRQQDTEAINAGILEYDRQLAAGELSDISESNLDQGELGSELLEVPKVSERTIVHKFSELSC